jgi:hypothetical protein
MSSPHPSTTDVVQVENSEMDEFAQATIQVEKEIEENFPSALVKVLKKIAYEVSVIGLSEREACLIASYPYEVFLTLKKNNKIIEQLIEMKDLEYKRGLLKNISNKARTTDDKLAQWLLEARYPKEFNRRKGSGHGGGDGDDDGNMIAMAVEFVRKNGDRESLVQEESGRAFFIKSKGTDKKIITDINQILK